MLGSRTLVDLPQHGTVGRFNAHQHVENAGLAIQRQQVSVAHNVGGPDGGEEIDRQFPASQFLQELLPDVAKRRRILVRQGVKLDVVGPVEPFNLIDQLDGIAVPPADPEAVLAAVGAAVRTAARELDDRGPTHAETAIQGPVLNQLPAHPVSVQIRERRPVRSENDPRTRAVGDACNLGQIVTPLDGINQCENRGLSFTPHDQIDGRFLKQDRFGVVGGVDSAIHGKDPRECLLDGSQQVHADRVSRGGTGMTGQDQIRMEPANRGEDRGHAEVMAFGVKQLDLMARIEKRAAEHQQTEGHLMPNSDIGCRGLIGWIDEQHLHGSDPRRGRVGDTTRTAFLSGA